MTNIYYLTQNKIRKYCSLKHFFSFHLLQPLKTLNEICTYWPMDLENSFASSFSLFMVPCNSITSKRDSPTILLKMRSLTQYIFSKHLFFSQHLPTQAKNIHPLSCLFAYLPQIECKFYNTGAIFFLSTFIFPIAGINTISSIILIIKRGYKKDLGQVIDLTKITKYESG